MSESKPRELGEQPALWLFQDFVDGDERDELLQKVHQKGRVERWGHSAKIPVFADGDQVVVVVDGNVVVGRTDSDDGVRLTRGDVFGKTPKGRISSVAGPTKGHDLRAIRETTISTIDRGALRDIWDSELHKSVNAGRWFQKQRLKVPVWPLVGTMPTTRLARVLLHLVEHYGEVDEDRGRLPVAMRPRQLAELAGIEKSRASQVWELFEQTGLVSIDDGAVILEQLPTLRNYALG